jgi:excisionase family DNA binding protein
MQEAYHHYIKDFSYFQKIINHVFDKYFWFQYTKETRKEPIVSTKTIPAPVDTLNASEVATIFRVSPVTVCNWVQAGKIRGRKIGHLYFIPRAEVERLLSEIEEGTQPK